MTDLTQAVEAARAFLTQAVSDPKEVQVEEIELGDDESTWSITLSYVRPVKSQVRDPFEPFRVALGQEPGVARYERVYRRIAVVDGEARSMTIREFASA